MTFWEIETQSGIVTAAYNNPPMNYFTAVAVGELMEHARAWHEPDIRVVIITGAVEGKFITHYSVEELAALPPDRAAVVPVSRAYQEFVLGFRAMAKPVIFAINGDAMGGGFEFALAAADIRIMQRGDYRIGLPEVRLGIIPGGGGTQLLARQIGLAKAADFLLRGKVVPPETALQLGLVHELASDAKSRAMEIARDFLTLSPTALAAAKRALYGGAACSLEDGLAIERDAFFDAMASAQAQDLMQAYVARPHATRRDSIDFQAGQS